MRVAFVSANQERMPDACIPLGLLCVYDACPEHHEKVFWDLCFELDPLAALRDKLRAFAPDVVAIGLRNLQNNAYTGTSDNLAYYQSLLEVVRTESKATVVLGGSAFSVMPAELMRVLGADFGIAGEGEGTLPVLLDALDRGDEDRLQIPGLFRGTRPNDAPFSGAFLDLTRRSAVDRSVLDPRYYERHGIDSVQTKRGCALRCSYCTYPRIEGRRSRLRDPDVVADEVLSIRDAGRANHVFFVDSVFNLPTAHASAVCQALVARGNDLPWTCYTNPLGFTPELAREMRAAGCVGMEIGSDSGSDEVLRRLDKGFDTGRIRAAHEAARAAGIKDCHTWVLGTPGETLDDVHRTLDFLAELDPFAAILMVWTDDFELLEPAAAEGRRALRAEILALLDARQGDFPRWVIPPLRTNFGPGLFRFLRQQGWEGPLWQNLDRAIPRPGRRRVHASRVH